MRILSIDVESNGLHGQGFAIGAVLTSPTETLKEYSVRCPITGPVNSWVAEHVLPALADMPVTHPTYGDMLEDFHGFLAEHSTDATILSFIPWPVETRVLSDIYSTDEGRWFDGPFPLIDLASILHTKGHDATSDDAYIEKYGLTLDFTGSTHHPVYDARKADLVYRHLMSNG